MKRDAQAITAEQVLKPAVPAGSRFKGYKDILVRDPAASAEVIRYRRERWVLPSGETVLAPLPARLVGGFGPELRRFMPRVDLPEILLEMHARTGFASEFTHASERGARAGDLATSTCPVCWPKPATLGWSR